eukprot:1633390-Pyramimonas_sp.AAC.1
MAALATRMHLTLRNLPEMSTMSCSPTGAPPSAASLGGGLRQPRPSADRAEAALTGGPTAQLGALQGASLLASATLCEGVLRSPSAWAGRAAKTTAAEGLPAHFYMLEL